MLPLSLPEASLKPSFRTGAKKPRSLPFWKTLPFVSVLALLPKPASAQSVLFPVLDAPKTDCFAWQSNPDSLNRKALLFKDKAPTTSVLFQSPLSEPSEASPCLPQTKRFDAFQWFQKLFTPIVKRAEPASLPLVASPLSSDTALLVPQASTLIEAKTPKRMDLSTPNQPFFNADKAAQPVSLDSPLLNRDSLSSQVLNLAIKQGKAYTDKDPDAFIGAAGQQSSCVYSVYTMFEEAYNQLKAQKTLTGQQALQLHLLSQVISLDHWPYTNKTIGLNEVKQPIDRLSEAGIIVPISGSLTEETVVFPAPNGASYSVHPATPTNLKRLQDYRIPVLVQTVDLSKHPDGFNALTGPYGHDIAISTYNGLLNFKYLPQSKQAIYFDDQGKPTSRQVLWILNPALVAPPQG
jgi:hypothetical protein